MSYSISHELRGWLHRKLQRVWRETRRCTRRVVWRASVLDARNRFVCDGLYAQHRSTGKFHILQSPTCFQKCNDVLHELSAHSPPQLFRSFRPRLTWKWNGRIHHPCRLWESTVQTDIFIVELLAVQINYGYQTRSHILTYIVHSD